MELLVASAVLTCGPILIWRRRDNVLGYLAVGIFASRYVVPLGPTLAGFDGDPEVLRLLADLLLAGAVAFAVGLGFGSRIGRQAPIGQAARLLGQPPDGARLALITRRVRALAVAGLVLLIAAMGAMGYVPYFEADRVAAKYGVGVYQEAFGRAAVVYRLGLVLSTVALPLSLGLYYRSRRWLDLALALATFAALFVTLSRESALIGPAVFAIAVLAERRHRAVTIGVVAVAGALLGTVVSFTFLADGASSTTDVASRVTESAPDLRDQLGFLAGFQRAPGPTNGRTLLAGLALDDSRWNPSTYALRTLTGFEDLTGFASGGLRLPAPLWGYVSFGWSGVLVFSGLSGLFTGWGLAKVRRALTGTTGTPGSAFALILAVTFFEATYGLLAEFFFLTTAGVAELVVVLALVGWTVAPAHTRRRPEPAGEVLVH